MKHTLRILVVVALVLAIAMLSQAQITSAASGNWSATGTWVGGVVPSAASNVIIANGHTVTIDANVTVAAITVGQGVSGTLTFDNAVKRSVVVTGDVTVATGGTFIAQTPITTTGDLGALSTSITNVASTAGVANGMNIGTLTGIAAGTTVSAFTANTITLSLASTNTVALVGAVLYIGNDDTLSIGGNLLNNGTFDMSRGNAAGFCHVNFTKAGDQTISGSGTLTRFRNIGLNKAALANKVIASINVVMAGSNLIYTAGTWEQSAGRLSTTSGSIAVGSATASVAANSGMNVIGSGGVSIASNLNIYGSFLLNTTDSLIVGSGASKIDITYIVGSTATFTKGTVLVLGKMAIASVSLVTFNGANIIIDPKGFTATDYAFRYTTGTGGASAFTFTSGTLTILNPNPTTAANPELAMSSSVAMVMTGTATIVLGQGSSTTASAAGFRINLSSAHRPNNLVINAGSVGVALLTNGLTLNGTLTITSCGTLGGSPLTWTAPRYVFNGTAAQVTGAIMPATAKYVAINNPAGVTSSQAVAIDTLQLLSGALSGPFTAGITITTDILEEGIGTPREFSMQQNYPNPFNPTTAISYQLSSVSNVDLRVFDMLGREVAVLVNGVRAAGSYSVQFDASGLSSGMYLYRLNTGTFSATKKMVLTK